MIDFREKALHYSIYRICFSDLFGVGDILVVESVNVTQYIFSSVDSFVAIALNSHWQQGRGSGYGSKREKIYKC